MSQYSINAFVSAKLKKLKLILTGNFFVLALTWKREIRKPNFSTKHMYLLNTFTASGVKTFKYCFSLAFHLLTVYCSPIDTNLKQT